MPPTQPSYTTRHTAISPNSWTRHVLYIPASAWIPPVDDSAERWNRPSGKTLTGTCCCCRLYLDMPTCWCWAGIPSPFYGHCQHHTRLRHRLPFSPPSVNSCTFLQIPQPAATNCRLDIFGFASANRFTLALFLYYLLALSPATDRFWHFRFSDASSLGCGTAPATHRTVHTHHAARATMARVNLRRCSSLRTL